ncbi:hypothetical protein Bbelb_189660 [Branchiostoma belcheri]|nr:hypothetical protein Bbelb_189660 [Branchiostoma belcheri]
MKSEGKKGELQTYRLVLLGNAGVGKSAITVRYLCGRFLHEYDPTLEDCYEKEETIDDQSMKIQIFDTAGQEGTTTTGDGYLDEAHGIVYIYDVTEQGSFDVASQFKGHMTEIKSNLPVLFIGNKVDLSHLRQVTTSDAEAFAKQHGWRFVEVSAAVDTESVRDAFHDLVRIIRVKEREEGNKPKKKMLRRRRHKRQRHLAADWLLCSLLFTTGVPTE